MKYSLTLKHIELTETDRAMIENKLQRLKKHLKSPWYLNIVFRRDTHHRSGETVTASLNVTQAGANANTHRTGATVQLAFDDALAAIKSELDRQKDRHKRT